MQCSNFEPGATAASNPYHTNWELSRYIVLPSREYNIQNYQENLNLLLNNGLYLPHIDLDRHQSMKRKYDFVLS